MSDLTGAAGQAGGQPHGDVITILLEQHRRIRELFPKVKTEQRALGADTHPGQLPTPVSARGHYATPASAASAPSSARSFSA